MPWKINYVYEPDDEEDDDRCDDELDRREREEEERLELAYRCKCGAFQINKKGDVIKVADCCCGAE